MEEKVFKFISDCGSFRGKMHSEISIYENRIEITRDTKWKVAKNTVIYFDNITSITHKEGGFGVSEQWISFSVPGVNPGYIRTADMGTTYIDLGISQAPWTDENSIIFRKDNSEVKEYYKKIQEIFGNYKKNNNSSSIVNVTQESAVDKLKKLKDIFDLGIITESEYREKRDKLLQEI